MELTKEQIQRVEKYLDKKGVKFIDFRIEIFDHIISQIEQKLAIDNADFKTVFYQVTNEWNKQLDETSSWFFGFIYPAPKVVINRAKKIFKKYLFLAYLQMIVTYLVVFNSKLELNKTFSYLIFFVLIILLLISIFYTFKIWKSKQKTVYSFIIKTQSLNFLFFPFMIIGTSFEDFINIGYLGYLIIITYYSRLFYRKHQQEKERYSFLMG
ncbi:hypothetical protein [Tenacibaculum ovolyticum]|uniref:hypothetical protein n=1 Tax=Tenacibaculum ovolyticum TaxID=104270 RepID=UPI0007ED5729|nr:hypothetical protein [Tenacibaculum ovolyticum]